MTQAPVLRARNAAASCTTRSSPWQAARRLRAPGHTALTLLEMACLQLLPLTQLRGSALGAPPAMSPVSPQTPARTPGHTRPWVRPLPDGPWTHSPTQSPAYRAQEMKSWWVSPALGLPLEPGLAPLYSRGKKGTPLGMGPPSALARWQLGLSPPAERTPRAGATGQGRSFLVPWPPPCPLSPLGGKGACPGLPYPSPSSGMRSCVWKVRARSQDREACSGSQAWTLRVSRA